MKLEKKDRKAYFIISLAVMLICNRLAYVGGRWISAGAFHRNLSLPVDDLIPFKPWTVVIYFGCVIWWGWIYWIISGQERDRADRFFCAFNLAHLICLVFFIALPTTNTRPLLQERTVWEKMVAVLYSIDSADNLFPSIHCMISWLCWAGTRDGKFPLAYRAGSLVMALLVCISTLTTRQHVLLDVAGGILLGEICYRCSGQTALRSIYSALTERIMDRFSVIQKRYSHE